MSKSTSKLNVLIPLFMVIFIDALGMTFILPIFAPLFSLPAVSGGILSWNLSLPMRNMFYGLTMAVYPIFMFFASPLLGDFSDRVGRKKVLLLCLFGEGVAAALSSIAVLMHGFVLFFISRIIAGGMAGSLPIAQAAITDISDEHDKTINVSLIGLAYTLGFVLGPIMGGVLANKHIVPWFGFSTPFFMTTILAFCNAIALIFTFRETFIKTCKTIGTKTIHIIKPLVMFVGAFRHKTIRNIALACFFYILGWNVYFQFIALYLFQKYHFTSMQLGYFTSWIAFMMSITMLFIIRVMVRYFTTVQILYFSIIVSIVGIFIGIAHSIAMQWISVVPIGCGLGLAYATLITLFSDAVSSDLQGWIMGVSAAIMAGAGGFAGLLVGVISAQGKLTFISIAILWALCFLFSLQIKTSNKKSIKHQ